MTEPLLEDLLGALPPGIWVNNLFQLGIGKKWQANLTDGKDVWEFGHGATPAAALQAAIRALAGPRTAARQQRQQGWEQGPGEPDRPKLSLAGLGLSGLVKK